MDALLLTLQMSSTESSNYGPVHEEVHNHSPATDFNPKRKIVLPIDETDFSQAAVSWALKNVVDKEDLVILLHVRNPLNEIAAFPTLFPTTPTETLFDLIKKESHKLLKSVAMRFVEQNINCIAVSLRGDAKYELETKIKTIAPDMVVVGSRSRNAVSRLFLGSVSNYLLHHLDCPVLIVPFKKQ